MWQYREEKEVKGLGMRGAGYVGGGENIGSCMGLHESKRVNGNRMGKRGRRQGVNEKKGKVLEKVS